MQLYKNCQPWISPVDSISPVNQSVFIPISPVDMLYKRTE